MAPLRNETYKNSPILRENEINANRSFARACGYTGIVLSIVSILYWVYIFTLLRQFASKYLLILILLPLTALILLSCFFYEKTQMVKETNFKVFLLTQFVSVISIINILFPKHGVIAWAACLVLSNHYYSTIITRRIFIITAIQMLISMYLGLYAGEFEPNYFNAIGLIEVPGYSELIPEADMDVVKRFYFLLEHPDRYYKIALFYYIPRLASLSVIYFASKSLCKRTRNLLEHEVKNAQEKHKFSAEMSIASSIQSNVLPTKFPNNEIIEINALMKTAKEVGGDFYDFFNIDEKHIGLVIADVSGKGVPAALFMMKARSVIKSLALTLKEKTNEILRKANGSLCEGNAENMFVTTWFGILNLDTGELKYTNGGHNPPFVLINNELKMLKENPGFVLGAFENIKLVENVLKLNHGDKIFLYTDGVTECQNENKELFGEKRLQDFLLNNEKSSSIEVTNNLDKELKTYANGEEQFDDITMLTLTYRGDNFMEKEKTFDAKKDSCEIVLDFVSDFLKEFNLDTKSINSVRICIEEMYVNIASYAYPDGNGPMTLKLKKEKDVFSFTLIDRGIPFNPLAKKDPNILASLEERQIGGLGIFMVKKMMDAVQYEYKDEQNIFVMSKEIKGVANGN